MGWTVSASSSGLARRTGPAMQTNLQDLASVTSAPLLGRVPIGTGRLNRVAFQANAAGRESR